MFLELEPIPDDADQGEPVECELVREDRSQAIRQAWGREWSNPAKRADRLKRHQAERAEAVQEGIPIPPQLAKRRGWPERSKAGASLSALLWKLGRRGRLVLDAYMAKPTTPDVELGKLVGRSGPWVQKLKNSGTWRMAGTMLIDMARPGAKLALEKQIVTDSLTPLESSEAPAALVKTREQAAALLGLEVKAPDQVEHLGQVDHVHRMASQYPREALEAYEATGSWDEARWGLPPWRNKQLQA